MRLKIAGLAVAASLAVMPSAFAQTPAPQTPAPKTTAQSPDTNTTQTFTGCVMTERDYRSAHKLGGGTAGGVGLGDEYVLVDVKVSAAKSTTEKSGTPAAPAGSTPSAQVASKCADKGVAYRLTGSDEEQLRNVVGRQLEIQGRFKHAADAAAGGTRPDEKLPAEVEMVSFREVPGPTAVTAPTAQTAPVQSPPVQTPPQTTPRQPTQPQTTPAPTTPATPEPRTLPQTAGSAGTVALIGFLALAAGLAVGVWRRYA